LMFMLHVSSMSSFGQNIAFCHLPIPSPSIILPFGKYNSCPWHQSKCPHHVGSKKFNSKDMSFFFGVCYHLSNNMKSWRTNVEIKDGCFWACGLSSVHTPYHIF
jgi:hypothetical protein